MQLNNIKYKLKQGTDAPTSVPTGMHLKPNSITLAGSELAPNKLRTSFERAPN